MITSPPNPLSISWRGGHKGGEVENSRGFIPLDFFLCLIDLPFLRGPVFRENLDKSNHYIFGYLFLLRGGEL